MRQLWKHGWWPEESDAQSEPPANIKKSVPGWIEPSAVSGGIFCAKRE